MSEVTESGLPFERDHPNTYEWTEKAFDMLLDGRLDGHVHRRNGLEAAAVIGACPRCGHTFRFDTSQVAIGTGRHTLGSSGPPRNVPLDQDEFVPVDVSCTCAAEHPGRRTEETGCGITFRVEIRPEDHDD